MKSTSTITFRPTEAVQRVMDKWLKQHSYLDRTTLINMAIMKFVMEPQVLEPVGVSIAGKEEVLKLFDSTMAAHKEAMDDLKNR